MRFRDNEDARIFWWNAVAAEFPPEAARWLSWLRDDPHTGSLTVEIGEDRTWCWKEEWPGGDYGETLIFRDVMLRGDPEFDMLWGAELSKNGDGYLLELLTEYPGENGTGDETVLEVFFSGLELEREFWSYGGPMPGKNCPWDTVGSMLSSLSYKAEMLGEEALNPRERALLPLVEFQNIVRFYDFPACITAEGAALFAQYAGRVGREDLTAQVESLVGHTTKRHAGGRVRRLWSALEKKESEGLWRAIYGDLKAAAGEYPRRYAECVKEKDLSDQRTKVTRALKSQGFEGVYPEFRRRGKLEGIHLRDAKGMTQFAGFGRVMDSYIVCEERYDSDGHISISYVTSAIFPRKEETDEGLDGFSGFFVDKDRRFAAAVLPALPEWEDGVPTYPDNGEVARLAAKTAKLEKLIKAEWKLVFGVDSGSVLPLLLGFTLIGGTMFGAVMSVGLGLVSLLIGGLVVLLTGKDVTVLWGMMASLPWLKLFLWSGGGFGVLMGGIMAISQVRSLNR